MRLIFWGLLLVFLDFNIGAVDVLPDFVGYLLMAYGMKRVEECGVYQAHRSKAIAAAVISILTWALAFMGARTLVVILGIVGAILQIYITYVIAQGVLELEEQAGYADWGGQKMMTAWKVTTVASILQVLLIYIVPAFGLLAALVAFVAFIFYLVYDNAAVNGYGE